MTHDARYAGETLTVAEKNQRVYEVRCPIAHGPDGPTTTRTLGGGITDWYTARDYAEVWRQRGVVAADVFVDIRALREVMGWTLTIPT